MKKFFGIIGDPIKHSLSPTLHNYWFEKYKVDASYSIIQIKENELKNIIKKIKDKELSGINITLPYKQKIVPHTDILINDAEITSSVNTIYLNDQGIVVGENTDVFGLQAAYLKELMALQEKSFSNWCWGCIAISFAVSKIKGFIMTIVNRTKEKCIFLKKI